MFLNRRMEGFNNWSWRGNPLHEHNLSACCSSLWCDASPEPPYRHSLIQFSVAKSVSWPLPLVGCWRSYLAILVDTSFGVLVKASLFRTDCQCIKTLCLCWITLTINFQRQLMLRHFLPEGLLTDLLFNLIFLGMIDQISKKCYFWIIGYAWFMLFL